MNTLQQARSLGQSIWLDNLSRALLREGTLRRLVDEQGLSGVTSNPTIFFNAISNSPYYRDDLARAKGNSAQVEARYESLVVPDIQAACDVLQSTFEVSGGDDGYVSLEVSPALAYDEEGTVAAARRLRAAVQRDNLLIKIPGTPAGVRALQRLIGEGCSINVTLMFSLHHVVEVAQAYTRGLRAWVERGGEARRVKSVASLFLSRVDTLVDRKLESQGGEQALALRGKSGVALAKLAYQRYKQLFHSPQFADLSKLGARPQYLLWASTGTKNPAYRDVLYVEPLIGPQTVNTMPDATLAAFRDHGHAVLTLERDVEAAEAQFLGLERIGIDMRAVGEELQTQGVKLFEAAFAELLKLLR